MLSGGQGGGPISLRLRYSPNPALPNKVMDHLSACESFLSVRDFLSRTRNTSHPMTSPARVLHEPLLKGLAFYIRFGVYFG